MKAVIQKVRSASVTVDDTVVGIIDRGLLVFVGFSTEDTQEHLKDFALKILNLRCFDNKEDHFGESLLSVQGGLLLVSQFTLYADCKKGRRPSFSKAATAEVARPLYEKFVEICKELYLSCVVQTGIFGADMEVSLTNDGPITLEIEM